jgi:hypothetical protein
MTDRDRQTGKKQQTDRQEGNTDSVDYKLLYDSVDSIIKHPRGAMDATT